MCTLQCFAIILPPVFTLKITLLSQPCLLGFWWDCLQSVSLHFFPSHSSRFLVWLRVCFLLSSTPLHTFYNNTTISSVAFHSSLSQFLSLQTSLSFSACHIVLLCHIHFVLLRLHQIFLSPWKLLTHTKVWRSEMSWIEQTCYNAVFVCLLPLHFMLQS